MGIRSVCGLGKENFHCGLLRGYLIVNHRIDEFWSYAEFRFQQLAKIEVFYRVILIDKYSENRIYLGNFTRTQHFYTFSQFSSVNFQ